jgi:hypothetical protein
MFAVKTRGFPANSREIELARETRGNSRKRRKEKKGEKRRREREREEPGKS